MTHTFKLARRTARFRAPLLLTLLAFTSGACDGADRLTNLADESLDPTAPADPASLGNWDALGDLAFAGEDGGIGEEEGSWNEVGAGAAIAEPGLSLSIGSVSMSSAFKGGIAFGTFHLPKSLYGKTYTGTLGNISPNQLIAYLETARRNGGKVMVTFSGNEKHFIKNRAFSMALWKQRVDRFRKLNLSSYIKDGTLIGHYLVDEPHDPANWGGRTIPLATIDEMAKYSKQLWPGLPTIARAWPKFLKGYNYRYLDAAWAQYSDRFGSVSTFMKDNVRDAKASGLALVVGMNQLAGGNKSGLKGFYSGRYAMSASQLRSWGATMLGDSYPCAFISWRYDSKYMGRSDVKSAMAHLAGKARSKATRSCKGGKAATSAPGGNAGKNQPSSPAGSGSSGAAPSGGSSSISLKVSGRAQSGRQYMTLTWSGIKGSTVDVYRNGVRINNTKNDGYYVNLRKFKGRITYSYQVCQKGTKTCSKAASVSFK